MDNLVRSKNFTGGGVGRTVICHGIILLEKNLAKQGKSLKQIVYIYFISQINQIDRLHH
jgi:hypothetical protein